LSKVWLKKGCENYLWVCSSIVNYVHLRFFKDENIPFHPKAYIVEYPHCNEDIFMSLTRAEN